MEVFHMRWMGLLASWCTRYLPVIHWLHWFSRCGSPGRDLASKSSRDQSFSASSPHFRRFPSMDWCCGKIYRILPHIYIYLLGKSRWFPVKKNTLNQSSQIYGKIWGTCGKIWENQLSMKTKIIQSWLQSLYEWRWWERSSMNGCFSGKPCLITGGYCQWGN